MKNDLKKQRTIAIEKLFNEEITKSERFRAAILIGLLGLEAVALVVIYFFYRKEYLHLFKTPIAIYDVLIFTAIIIVFEFLMHYVLGKKDKPFLYNTRFFGYFNSFSEITLLTLLFIFIVQYSGQSVILQMPATLTYFVFIVLSTFRLNFKLSVFTGVLAAAEYIAIAIYYSTYPVESVLHPAYPKLTGMQYLGQGLIMIITGIAAGFVADLIRKKMIVSWNTLWEKNKVIDLFGQQISPQIAENILNEQDDLSGARKKVCIMFLDIRQFTPFVEQHQPEEVVNYLNTLFGFMIDIVQAHQGVINQFLGDGFMATFGAPFSIGNSSQQATDAACEIVERTAAECEKRNIPPTRIGIGLHYDEAVTGNIGSSSRKQYSITGKVVIMASRIEQLNKKYNTSLLISKEVYEQLKPETRENFEWLEVTRVKGSKNPVSLYKYKETSTAQTKNS
ncbi:adenylate/guanylate cyclase domain-containing protein [Candidatus Sulfidibacterium hydrothermale]|uniref:adenylate/guanylate cyclase domain-containing protein n=1 Tax=Candidatus Sulfidibacterium hydrothermale TaxID=2875962 RepID=UPI001F0AFFE3|nr:adenylate/guanylate cyclase domain-containing protein [Candidatus Sulfidibacterium hydrothermale]UBM61161.1 adenylate/guanylate cyclase domain-containing protein [Candidatus Sulfidibacterium hydrothermale]